MGKESSPGRWVHSFAVALACGLLGLIALPVAGAETPPSDAKVILIDGTKEGRTFEGVGGVSAGASSRLLIEYPEPQRSEILDFLFKPDYGAALQHLKVEVGGDVNSTDGCEPSHMHSREDENYTRGYEWWLMEEAKKRNPGIIFDCLAWGAPAWIGNGKYFSQDMADYLVKFIQGAKSFHNLDISYVGTWNESNNMGVAYNPAWIKLLRKTLDENNLHNVGIVAPDQTNAWHIVDEMNRDPAFKAAVQVVGIHYPQARSSPSAQASGIRLWSSEDGPWRGDWGGTSGASRLSFPQLLNQNYITGRITKTEIWSPITSYYDNLPLSGSGLMRANSPWSGNYTVQPAIWCVAHTTQFAQPGWKYLDGACQMLDGGSVVTLKSPTTKDYSIIIETMAARQRRTLTFQVTGNLSSLPLNVWHSNAKAQFVRQEVVKPELGKFTFQVEPGSIYSLTTTTGQQKGTTTPPPAKPFPFPYSEDFESYEVGKTPHYTVEQCGVFEVIRRADGKGKALHLASPHKGIEWARMNEPQTFLGSLDWKNYSVSADYLLNIQGNVALYGRIGPLANSSVVTKPPAGYALEVHGTGVWELRAAAKVIASGKVPFALGSWHNLGLQFAGDSITVQVDKNIVAQVRDATFKTGMIGLGCGWHEAQFDNLTIQ